MPTRLSERIRGLTAAEREGDLASAHVIIEDDSGVIIAENDAAIGWDEVHWITGGKNKKSRDPMDVLVEAAQAVSTKTVKGLIEKLKNE